MIYVFDGFELDTALYTLTRDGKSLRLRPKIFQVLTYLIDHRDRVVSKNELCEQLWPDQFISNAALESTIRLVRQTVGDSGRAQRIIQTFYGHGYRFVAQFYRCEDTTSEEPSAIAPRSAAAVPPPDSQHAGSIPPQTALQQAHAVSPRLPSWTTVNARVSGSSGFWGLRSLTPEDEILVGQQTERLALDDILTEVKHGHGHVVQVVGDPGMGKSRLLEAFCRSLRRHEVTCLRIDCPPADSGMPALPVRDLLQQVFEIASSDPPETTVTHVCQRLREVEMEPDVWSPFLLYLLGVGSGRESLTALSPKTIESRTVTVFRQLLQRSSLQRPLIVVIDDFDHIDSASAVYVASLLEGLSGFPIFLLLAFRPEYSPPWAGLSSATQLLLAPLSDSDSWGLVHAVVPSETFSDCLVHEMMSKASGNPLYLKQAARMAAEQGTACGELPGTIREVIKSRVTSLPEPLMRLLQVASVLGPVVSLRLLEALWECDEDFLGSLAELQQRRLWHVQRDAAKPFCLFAHEMIRQMIYESLPDSRRRSLHTAVAEILEALHPTHHEEIAVCLAHHYVRAELPDKALPSLISVAKQAQQRFAYTEAAAALRLALSCLERLAATEDREQQETDLRLRLGEMLMHLGRYSEALDLLLAQRPLRSQPDGTALAAGRELLLARLHSRLGAWEAVSRSAHRAVAAVSNGRDEELMGQAYHILAMERYWSEDPLRGLEYGRQAVRFLQGSPERYRLGWAYVSIALHALVCGDFIAAAAAAARVQEIGEGNGDTPLQDCALWVTGWIDATRGNWEDAIRICRLGLKQASDLLNAAFALGGLGYAFLEKGDAVEAIPILQQAAQSMLEFQHQRLSGFYTTLLGEAFRMRGQLDRADGFTRHGLALATDTGYRLGIAWCQRILGGIELARGAFTSAQQHLHEALAIFAAIPARFEVGRTHLALSEFAVCQHRYADAIRHIDTAHDLFMASQATRYVTLTEQRAHHLRTSS